MKFIHIADIHASRERLPQTLHILSTLTERCKRGDIDFILFAGDFWDSTITATKGSGFSDIIAAIRKLEKHTHLIFIYGTPSHEPKGSLDAFASPKCYITSEFEYGFQICTFCNFVLIPEPRRSDFVAESSEKVTDLINKTMKKYIKSVKFSDDKTPTIVVYHGEVKGAVYQNGVSASSPTAIPKELLQSLNADYYALGHIHAPQEVFKNAWYSGSACPKDFGEIHDGSYNLVEVENGETKVERVSLGLPTFETYDIFFSDFAKIAKDFSNKYIRLRFDCTKEEKKSLNVKKVCEEIKERTHALSVKFEPNVIECENVKKSEVVKHKSIVEKMCEYAKEKEVKLPKHAKELLQDIQDNTLIKLSFPQHSFELLSLSLRGAIGIRDGQQKEDFELNFEQYEDGVVCLIGDNGRGKTTLVENCHPYPSMLSRDGTLKDHFYLKDSHRILTYKDENGLYYKISMLIDGKTATGKVSYFVETSKDRENWKSLPEVDGSFEAYKQWVNSTFGSIDVFLRTAFFAKEQTKNAVDISDTTKSERMELLSKLAGTDYLKEVSKVAKDLRKVAEKSSELIKMELESFSRYEKDIEENNKNIAVWSDKLKTKKSELSDVEKDVADLKVKDAEYKKVMAIAGANTALYEQYSKQIEDKNSRIKELERCINNKEIFDNIAKCKVNIEKNKPVIAELDVKVAKLRKERDEVRDKVTILETDLIKCESRLDGYAQRRNYLKKQSPVISDNCPTCGAPLSAHKKAELQKHIDDVNTEYNEVIANIALEKEQFSNIKAELSEIDTTEKLTKQISDINTQLLSLANEQEENTDYIAKYNNLYSEHSYEEIVSEYDKLNAEVEELAKKMGNIKYDTTLVDVSKELADKEVILYQLQSLVTEFSTMIKSAEQTNIKYQKELDSVSDKKKELKELSEKIIAYTFIEGAFSNDGIPAIELRESAPEIADIANKILADSYGNKFEIRFGSTSELKTKRKANEDFNIIVYDSENGDEKTIDLVSSGERIWIKQALFYAFSIVQMNRTGFNFRTRLIDESDGSLDGSLRPKYLNMVTSAHKYASARVTILITHSQEIKDIAQQIIEI